MACERCGGQTTIIKNGAEQIWVQCMSCDKIHRKYLG